jgi:uncharacterized membrane protein YhiD involved in acid resistance
MLIFGDILHFIKKYWFIAVIAFIITIFIQSQRKAAQIINLQQETYQKEKQLLENSHKEQLKQIRERMLQYEEDKKKLVEEQEKLRADLKKKKTQIIKKYIVLWQDDLPGLKKELETLFDIEEWKGNK